MLKERADLIKKANIVCDAALVVVSFIASYNLRVRFGGGLDDLDNYAWILLVVVPVWGYLLDHFGFYGSHRMTSPWTLLMSLAKVTGIGGVITSSSMFLIEPHAFSRGFLVVFLILSFLVLALEQLMVRFSLRVLRLEGYNYRNILLVGTGSSARRILRIIETHKEWGFQVVGVLQTSPQLTDTDVAGHPIIGTLTDMVEVCKAYPVDEVIFCDSKEECRFEVADYINELDVMGITARTVLNLYYRFDCHKELGMLHGEVPLLTFRPVSLDPNQLFLKRCLDIAGASFGLACSAVLFPLIALAIKLESPGPLFFGQTRVRENGRTFTCWKFRSMYIDAEERKKELMHLNEMSGAIFKMKNDPRVTRVGAFLRKTSLDELPQFWNVLKGEMSLVGTRPPTPAEVEGYENWQRKRICIKPGITGLWQVSGRNSITDFNDVVRLDLEYIDSWSFLMDLRLILRTLKVVFLREGAC